MKTVEDVVVALRRLVADGESRRDLAATVTMDGLGFSGCYTNGMGIPMLEDAHPGLKPMREAGGGGAAGPRRGLALTGKRGGASGPLSPDEEREKAELLRPYNAHRLDEAGQARLLALYEPDDAGVGMKARAALTSEEREVLRRVGMDEGVATMPETANFNEWQALRRRQTGGGA